MRALPVARERSTAAANRAGWRATSEMRSPITFMISLVFSRRTIASAMSLRSRVTIQPVRSPCRPRSFETLPVLTPRSYIVATRGVSTSVHSSPR